MDKWLKRNTTINSSSDGQPSSEDKKSKTSWSRKCFDEYLKFGFIIAGSDNHLLLCVVCHATFQMSA
jgi:hypothetical protein